MQTDLFGLAGAKKTFNSYGGGGGGVCVCVRERERERERER